MTVENVQNPCGGKGNTGADDKTPEPYITGISTD